MSLQNVSDNNVILSEETKNRDIKAIDTLCKNKFDYFLLCFLCVLLYSIKETATKTVIFVLRG